MCTASAGSTDILRLVASLSSKVGVGGWQKSRNEVLVQVPVLYKYIILPESSLELRAIFILIMHYLKGRGETI